jgi:Flp pilus assembly protein TadB
MQSNRPYLRLGYAGARRDVPGGWLGKAVALAAGAVVLVAALVFSLVLVAVLLALGVIFGGYVWWRTRALRRQLREQVETRQAHAAAAAAAAAPGPEARAQGEVIEGEFARMPGGEQAPPRGGTR